MVIGVCKLELYIPGNGSLKEKRRILKGMLSQVRVKFNVAVSEVGNFSLWQKSSIGVACVTPDKRFASQILNKVVDLIKGLPSVQILDYEIEML
ncbi:MAG: DUF503 domain-containing protein [bacterium]|nr:DUF503 domain-containing protein [bacterium]